MRSILTICIRRSSFEVKAHDGTTLYATLLLPEGCDANLRRPQASRR